MAPPWTEGQLAAIARIKELAINAPRSDGSLRRWTPIWVVRVDEDVYVRTWFRRTGGWFGHAVGSGRARVRAPNLEADVVVEEIGPADASLRAAIDAAYREKYGATDGAVGRMVGDEAAGTTLRLSPSAGTITE
jgi:hypothetical protein